MKQNNKDELIQLIKNHPNNYSRIITSFNKKYLKDFIELSTPLLNDKMFTMATKCYWILNDLKDFPKCKICGSPIKSNVKITLGYSKYCSNRCAQSDKDTISKVKKTKLEKYGSETYNNQEKTKETCLERYGVSSPNKSKCVREKIKTTCLERYGVDSNLKIDSFQEQRKHTWFEKYGTENPMCLEQVRDKYVQTCIKKYGVENVSKSDEIKRRKEETCLKHYGVKCSLMSDDIKKKIRKTNLIKYGVEIPAQNHEIFCKSKKKYKYNNIMFHSSWEVFVYFYLKDHSIQFEYQPKTDFVFEHERKDT